MLHQESGARVVDAGAVGRSLRVARPSSTALLVGAFHPSRVQALRRAIGGRWSVVACPCPAAADACLQRGPVDLVILDARSANDATCRLITQMVRARSTAARIVVYAGVNAGECRLAIDLVRSGCDDVVFEGEDVGGALSRRPDADGWTRRAAEAFQHVGGLVPPTLQAFLTACLSSAVANREVPELARAAGLPSRTLEHRLRAAGLPSPRTVFSWCRVLAACSAFDQSSASIERVALQLEFGSASAMRGLFLRTVGVTPGELRRSGGFERALRAFAQRLRPRHGRWAETWPSGEVA